MSSASSRLPAGLDQLLAGRRFGWFLSVLLAGATLVVNWQALRGGWRFVDDVVLVISSHEYSFLSVLISPASWRTVTAASFTPLLFGHFRLASFLFGFNPAGYYFLSIVDLALVVVLTHRLLLRSLHPLLALLASIGLLLSIPSFATVNYLFACHYLIGLLFSLASILVHQNAYRGRENANLLWSALLFFLALLSKELYVMVILYFLSRSWGTALFRKSLLVYSLVMLVFFLWRWWMLGNFVGGYVTGNFSLVQRLFAMALVHRAIFGGDLPAVGVILAVSIAAIHYRLVTFRNMAFLVMGVTACYLPLFFATFPLLVEYARLRLVFFPLWLMYFGVAHFSGSILARGYPRGGASVLLGVIGVTTMASLNQMGDLRKSLREYDAQVSFIRRGGGDAAIIPSPTLVAGAIGAHLHRTLAQIEGISPSKIVVTRDDVVPGILSYWGYDKGCLCMIRYSDEQARERLQKLPSFPSDTSPLAILSLFEVRGKTIGIRVMPERRSKYFGTAPGMLVDRFEGEMLTSYLDLSRGRIYRFRDDGKVAATPYMNVPLSRTTQWDRGVFLEGADTGGMMIGRCGMEKPEAVETAIGRDGELELRGWISLPQGFSGEEPSAQLIGPNGRRYLAKLYRDDRAEKATEGGKILRGIVLDADVSRVEPGSYRLEFGAKGVRCDTGKIVTVQVP